MKKIILFTSLFFITTKMVTAQEMIVLTTDGKIATMADANMPNMISTPMSITGVATGMSIVGIDYRPNTGQLYALAYNNTAAMDNAQLYVINPADGSAMAIGAVITLSLGTNGIGFDFNPTVDRIRVVAANGMNYRLHPVTGAIAATDGSLAFAGTDMNAGMTPTVAACAYTNSYIGTEATTLYDFDVNLNSLLSQVPPNAGTLNTIGMSGITVNSAQPTVGMDIYFDPMTKTNWAYLNANVGTSVNDNLYTINLTTGAVTSLGAIGEGMLAVKDIAAVINRDVPATFLGQLVYGLTKNNRNLITFSTDAPQLIRSLMPITGLSNNHKIVGMDVRPLDLNLYALGYNDTTMNYGVYRIDVNTGLATKIGDGGTVDLGMNEQIGFDFNPTVDRIRVTSTNDSNYRFNPISGLLAITDTSMAYVTGDVNVGGNPHIGSVAYINSYKGTTTTKMYGIDEMLNAFVNIAPPNQGKLLTIASDILTFNPADKTVDIDFYYDSVTATNFGYMVANMETGANDALYTINELGEIAMINTIGWGIPVMDIAVQLTFTNTATSSISPIAIAAPFAIYPNPATNLVTLSFLKNQQNENGLQIIDISGRIVKTQTINKNNTSPVAIDISALQAGIYIIKVGNSSVKFIKK